MPIAAHGHALDEAQHAAAVFDGDALLADQELLQQRPGHLVVEVLVARERRHETACEVLRQASDLVREPRHVVLADVIVIVRCIDNTL